MPRTTVELDDREVRMACAYWVEQGCPQGDHGSVFLYSTPGSDDPREPSGPTVSATVEKR